LFVRRVVGWTEAHSEEFEKETKRPVIVFMPEIDKEKMGGTMRLGKRATIFDTGSETSSIRQLYGNAEQVNERHRHRYEVNPAMVAELQKHGLRFVGKDVETGQRMEIVELKDHPYYVGTQYHPEYLTRPLRPSPPFLGFVKAAVDTNSK